MKKVRIVAIIITILFLMSLNTYAVETTEKAKEVELSYYTHVQDIGWEEKFCHKNGEIAGTTGQCRKIEAIEIKSNRDLEVQEHIQDIGWIPASKGKNIKIGTEGKSLRLEAFKILI